MNIKYEALVQQ